MYFHVSVLGAAALCLFPLWPDELRIGVYYVSLAGAGFVGFIIVLVIGKFINLSMPVYNSAKFERA